MLHKTIAFELLQSTPMLHEQLRRGRMLLAAADSLAQALKARQEALRTALAATKPELGSSQAASAAMELAVREMEHRLQTASRAEGQEPLSLNAAIVFVCSLTSHG